MTIIELVVELVSGRFHAIENVEAPVDGVVVVGVLIGADVAHALLATVAHFQSLHMWVLVFIMHAAGRNVASGSLGCLERHSSLAASPK